MLLKMIILKMIQVNILIYLILIMLEKDFYQRKKSIYYMKPQKMMNHKDIRMTLRYAKLSNINQKIASDKLDF